jgi:hypothetical protein
MQSREPEIQSVNLEEMRECIMNTVLTDRDYI